MNGIQSIRMQIQTYGMELWTNQMEIETIQMQFEPLEWSLGMTVNIQKTKFMLVGNGI